MCVCACNLKAVFYVCRFEFVAFSERTIHQIVLAYCAIWSVTCDLRRTSFWKANKPIDSFCLSLVFHILAFLFSCWSFVYLLLAYFAFFYSSVAASLCFSKPLLLQTASRFPFSLSICLYLSIPFSFFTFLSPLLAPFSL